jgi:hypothetical protein
MGDAFLVDFPSVVNAVQCAQAVQAQLHKHNAEKDKAEQIHVRIGIHLGVKVRISSDSMGSLRCPTLAGERKERSNEYGAESDHGEGGVVRAG